MKRSIWKVMLVFSALLVFALPGELAAQVPDGLVLNPGTATLALKGSQAFTARLTSSGTGVEGEWIYFDLSPGLGELSGTEDGWVLTDGSGYATVTYTAGTVSGIDTLVVTWYEPKLRANLVDTVIITINPGSATSLNVLPLDTVVVVTQNAIIVAELWDDYNNHVNATSPSQVSFATSGLGTPGTASVNGDGCIEMAYATDDSMVYTIPDTITVELLVNHTKDYCFIYTVGAAPATMNIYATDSSVCVYDDNEYFWFELLDQYGNPSAWSDYYGKETYEVSFTVSTGGGDFEDDEVNVDDEGGGYNWYYPDTVAVVRTVTGTCGDATDDIDITQIPDYPDELVLAPDSIAIPAGSDTTLTATMFDRYNNHCDADDSRFYDVDWYVDDGNGSLGTPYIEDHNWKCVFTSYEYAADTSVVWTGYPEYLETTVTIFSAEPGDLDHFVLDVVRDSVNVSDGNIYQTNVLRIEAQDVNNIRIWTYTNPDTVTLSLVGSSAGESQVVWYLNPIFYTGMAYVYVPDTIGVGLNAFIPGGTFDAGELLIGIANQIAETVPVTATDTAGNTGTSSAVTWLPIDVVAFTVGLEGGIDTIETDDTVNVEVTAIDMFGNTTDVGLPLNVVLSANRTGVIFPAGTAQLMETAVDLFPTRAASPCSGLIITVADILTPAINGSSYPIEVIAAGVEEGPVVSNISAKFGSGEILYSVADEGNVEIKVYDKAGRVVGVLVDGVVKSGYYQASLKGLNLASDVYFVVMKGPGINKGVKVALIK